MTHQQKDNYEKRDVNVTKIAGVTIVIIVFLAAVLIFLSEFFIFSKEKMIYENVLKPESVQLRDLRAKEDKLLNTYEIVDEAEEIYRIPVSRAMKLEADEAYQKRKDETLR
ncbi:MAG: hypothetical protein GF313_08640 [Caldithrix sp.]|nr:hypothetical protein [Caldithrix sp.]